MPLKCRSDRKTVYFYSEDVSFESGCEFQVILPKALVSSKF